MLSLAISGTRLGTLRDGAFRRTRVDVFRDPQFQLMAKAMFNQRWITPAKQLGVLKDMEVLIRTAADQKRGGTIILASRQDFINSPELIESGTFGRFEHLQNDFRAVPTGYRNVVLDEANDNPDGNNVHADRRRYLQFVAQLSAIDGALIIDEKFEPLAVGAKLKAPPFTGYLCQGGKPESLVQATSDSVGTRHTSARNFVASSPGSMAFVISSDGPVTVLIGNQGQVAVWRNVLGE